MSIAVMSEVWKYKCTSTEQQILLAMADHADDDGVCWPSVRKVAWKIGVSARTVQRIWRILEGNGVLVIEKHATPTRPKIYRLCLDVMELKEPFRGVKMTRGVAVVSGGR